jgi:quercetin dioxygenase-like cupin family protein
MILKNLDKAGKILSLDQTENIKSGVVILQPGQEVGKHITENREEVIIVLEGQATVLIYEKNLKASLVKAGQLVYISQGVQHNVKNNTDKILRYIYLVSLIKYEA